MNNMQNQFKDIYQIKIEELIKPYQEKIKKLEDEIRLKDLEITQLKFKLFQNDFNQQLMNQGKNQMNNIKDTNNLLMKFNFENKAKVQIQCKSNDKMEVPIKHFAIKVGINIEDYDFHIVKKIKDMNSTIEENGLTSKKYYIQAQKKSNDNEESSGDENDIIQPNLIPQIKINGDIINLFFIFNTGLKVIIKIGIYNTFKESVIKLSQKIGLSFSKLKKNYVFLYNARKLSSENEYTLGQNNLRDKSSITVICQSNLLSS